MGSIIIDGLTFFGSKIEVNGKVTIDGKVVDGDLIGRATTGNTLNLKIEGDVTVVNADGSVTCGNVASYVSANGSVTCGNVAGDVNAGGSVKVEGVVEGDVEAGGSVKCGPVGGKISAGGSVKIS